MSIVNILLNMTEGVGSIQFSQPVSEFPALRLLSGIRLQIPALLTFQPPTVSKAPLLLENLQVVLSVGVPPGAREFGTARFDQSITTERRNLPISFSLDVTVETLAAYERLRDGTEPNFQLSVSGDIRFLFPTGNSHHQVASTAYPFCASGQVQYSREAWTKMLRSINFRDAVLVEIPYSSQPPDGWEGIWGALRDARDAFDSGGTTGWKNSVTSARLALERWAELEKVDHGPGWKSPSMEERKQRSKRQRVDNIRWHLYQLAHDSAHSGADKWTRDDAVLMLSTLSALLSVRNP